MKRITSLTLMAAVFLGVAQSAAELSTTVDPAKQAAWEEAQAQAAKRVADFESAVKAGKPERIRKAGLDLQSDPMAVQKLNQANRPDLVNAHNEVTEQIKTGAKRNIKDNMAKEWNRLHPNDPPITRNDVEVYEPTNYKDPSAKPKSGQDWDVTVRVKPKGAADFVDVPPGQSQKVVEKSYYDAAGGEKTFGKRPPGVTPEQAAASAAHRQAVETTHGKSPEAYNQPETILGTKTEKPRTGEKLADSEQLTQAIENKSNQSRNKAEQAAASGNSTEAVRQEAEQMRQASKQYDKITKPRVEAAGGEVHSQVEKGMNIVRDAGAGKISPEQARAELAKMGETPESMISKASGQAEAAQKLTPKPPELTKTSAPEPVSGKVAVEGPEAPTIKGGGPEPVGPKVAVDGPDAPKVKAGGPESAGVKSKVLKGAGAVLIGIDIGATAEDVKEDLKRGDVKGAATKVGEAGANVVTAGGYSTVKGTKEKYDDMSDAEKQIAQANKQNEATYDLQAEKKLRQAGVSRDEVTKIMDAKAKGDESALENKFNELGIKAPEKIVEKAPESDDSAGERTVAVGKGLVESTQKAGKFVKETVQDVTEITTGVTEKGVAAELVKQTKENISDWRGTQQENATAEKTTEDFKQGVKDRLIAKGATPEGAQKAADALVNQGDPSMVKKLNDLLDKKNGLTSQDAKTEASEPGTKTSGDTPGTKHASLSGLQAIKDSAAEGVTASRQKPDKVKQETTSREISPDEQKLRDIVEARLRSANLPVNELLLDRLVGSLRDGGEKALDAAIKEFQDMQGTFAGGVKMPDGSSGATIKITVSGGRISGTFAQSTSSTISNSRISRKLTATVSGRVDLSSGAVEMQAKGPITATVTVIPVKGTKPTPPATTTMQGVWNFRGSFNGSGYKGSTEMPWSVSR